MATETIYKTYTIVEDYRNPYSNKPEFMYFITEHGEQHDYDFSDDEHRYCGNCKWADTLEDAQAEIDELLTEKI